MRSTAPAPQDPYEDDEDVVIRLTSRDPQRQKNVVRFSHSMGEFMEARLSEFIIDHLNLESPSIHRESEEGQEQLTRELISKCASKTKRASSNKDDKEKENEGDEDKEVDDQEQDNKPRKKKTKGKNVTNKKTEGKGKGKGGKGKKGTGKKTDAVQVDDEEEVK